jgi:RNA polymerase sigma-70 factor (ECF subfamily)
LPQETQLLNSTNALSELSDEKIMELYTKGEYSAFEVIYKRHKSKIYSYLQKRLRKSPEAVEDIFQNIFIKFHKSRERYNPKYPLMKWLYTISRSEMLDYLKKPSLATTELEDWHQTTDSNQEDEINHPALDLDAQSHLSEKEQLAIKLRYFSDQDFDEISLALNTSQSNARKLISRGLAKLRLKHVKASN